MRSVNDVFCVSSMILSNSGAELLGPWILDCSSGYRWRCLSHFPGLVFHRMQWIHGCFCRIYYYPLILFVLLGLDLAGFMATGQLGSWFAHTGQPRLSCFKRCNLSGLCCWWWRVELQHILRSGTWVVSCSCWPDAFTHVIGMCLLPESSESYLIFHHPPPIPIF